MKKITEKCLLVISVILLLHGCSAEPSPAALASFNSANVVVDEQFYLFRANEPSSSSCFIFYPGGLVKPEAYAPFVKTLADNGVHSYILKLTMDLAVLDMNAADDARNDSFAQQHCQHFVIGGHSLGGTIAADYVSQHPDDGLILLGAYPRAKTSLVDHAMPVLSLYASNDQLSSVEEILASKKQFPAEATFIEISGGNHAQFGFYGPQKTDGVATITQQQQQAIVVQQSLALIQTISEMVR